MNDPTSASASWLIGGESLKLRRNGGVGNVVAMSSPSDCHLERAECVCGRQGSSLSYLLSPSKGSHDTDESEYKKDDDHCGGSSGLSSTSSVSPLDRQPNDFSMSLSLGMVQCCRIVVFSALPRIVAASTVLLVLPFVVWDSHPVDVFWGPVVIVRHAILVWNCMLQFAAWPVVLVTSLIAALRPIDTTAGRGGKGVGGSAAHLSIPFLGSTKDNAAATAAASTAVASNGGGGGASATSSNSDRIAIYWTSMPRSSWKMPLFISIIFSILVITNMTLQMVAPHVIWNPFIWGRYRVYLPDGIVKNFEGACLGGGDGGNNAFSSRVKNNQHVGASNRSGNIRIRSNGKSEVVENNFRRATTSPLCLSEKQWNELSSGRLSSHDPVDVSTVVRGLDYLRNESGGLMINALARNVVDSIPALRHNMDGLASLLRNKGGDDDSSLRITTNRLSLVVFENDSTDGTREALQRWSDEESSRHGGPRYVVDVMSCGPRNPECKLGIVDRYDVPLTTATASGVGRLGEFRQILMDYILGKEQYREYSHMVVLDVDLGVSLSPLGLLHTLGIDNGHLATKHVVASASVQVWPGTFGTITPPYDFSAFRPKKDESNTKVRGMHKRFCELMPVGDRWRNLCDASSPMQLFMIQSANDVSKHADLPYEVTSAFNGLTMYPLELIRERGTEARYDAGNDSQRCEHVGFHLSLDKAMYVNPKWMMKLRPERPGGPSGIQAVKTLFYAICGRPAIVTLMVLTKLCFFFVIVSATWVIVTTMRSLWRICPEGIWGLIGSLGQHMCRGNIRCLFIEFDMRGMNRSEKE